VLKWHNGFPGLVAIRAAVSCSPESWALLKKLLQADWE